MHLRPTARGHIVTVCCPVTVGRRVVVGGRVVVARRADSTSPVGPCSRSPPPNSARPGGRVAPSNRSSCGGSASITSVSTAETHRGDLIVHEDLVSDVIAIFEQLYRLGYPVEKIRTVDHYSDANDELSMEDNNTSAFNCRTIPGSDEWSPHAYGRAIDLNPLINPCLYASGYFEPQNAAAYLDRSRSDPGLLHVGDPAVHVFTDRGWRWGGEWAGPLDYQHFERL